MSTSSCVSETWLLHTIDDLFVAGYETTLTTLQWGILFLLHNPEVQIKVQEEMDNLIGTSRSPKYDDRAEMHYTMATISEIQRCADIVPFSVLHQTMNDVSYGGYHIPSGTQVLPNLYGVHHDPKYWSDPEKFNPQIGRASCRERV